MKLVYLVEILVKELDVVAGNKSYPLKMGWAEGVIGVVPVFETKEAAEQYAAGKFAVMTMEVVEEEAA